MQSHWCGAHSGSPQLLTVVCTVMVAKHPHKYHCNYLQVHVCLKRETTCIPLTCDGQETDGSSTIIRLLYFHNKSAEDCPTNLHIVSGHFIPVNTSCYSLYIQATRLRTQAVHLRVAVWYILVSTYCQSGILT